MLSGPSHQPRQTGTALVIVLAFILLLTGLTLAFFSRSASELQTSNSSANQSRVDILAQGATEQIVGDLRQEIMAGSVRPFANPAPGVTIYLPKPNSSTMMPALVGSTGTGGYENLVKRSVRSQPFYAGTTYGTDVYPPSNRAAPSSSLKSSSNGRFVSPARWNKPLLLAKKTPASSTDLSPLDSTGAGASAIWPNAPDWVLVARDGSNPSAWTASMVTSKSNVNTVVGRYAYNLYDEGGLLDINVAGFPVNDVPPFKTGNFDVNAAYKNALAFVDLTQLPGISEMTAAHQKAVINALTGWRNYASLSTNYTQSAPVVSTAPAGSFPSYTFSTANLANFSLAMLENPAGFLKNSNVVVAYGQTDRLLASRQQALSLLLDGIANTWSGGTDPDVANLQNAFRYLTHFSRDLSQPSFVRLQSTDSTKVLDYNSDAPKVLPPTNGGNVAYGMDDKINPSFLGVRVLKDNTFSRADGSKAVASEPLVKKRFALNRLAWLSYKGPSALRTQSDPDIQALIKNGVPWSYLQQGTAANIQKYFGLNWDSGNLWRYNVHNGSHGNGTIGPIMKLGDIVTLSPPHEPDFFELLKAAINVGSIGKALLPSNNSGPADVGGAPGEQPYNYAYYADSSVDFQILQIGANIINQYQPHNFPFRIIFDDGGGSVYSPRTIVGVVNLPYLFNVVGGILQLESPNPLPRNGRNNYTGDPGTGVGADSGYKAFVAATGAAPASGDKIVTPGVGALMEIPVIWNPHDPSSPLTNAAGLSPVQIRVVADSTTPDQAEGGGNYNSFFVTAGSVGSTIDGTSSYSLNASTDSPDNAWYRDPSGTGFSLKRTFTATNTEIDLQLGAQTNRTQFPEPAMLMRPGVISDLNGNSATVAVGSGNAMLSAPVVSEYFGGGGLKSCVANAPGMASGEMQDIEGTPYIGFYLGAFPMAWVFDKMQAPLSAAQSGAYLQRYNGSMGAPPGSSEACYMTYRMQYKDVNTGNWVTYDTKYGRAVAGSNVFTVGPADETSSHPGLIGGAVSSFPGLGSSWASATDPRTSRFGLLWQQNSVAYVPDLGGTMPGVEFEPQWDNGPVPNKQRAAGWLDTTNAIIYTTRPDAQSGFFLGNGNWPAAAREEAGWMAYVSSNDYTVNGIVPGLLSQNNTDVFFEPYRYYGSQKGHGIHTPNYFADPDGMVRRAMGGAVPTGSSSSPAMDRAVSGYTGIPPSADTTVGLPMARAFNWNTYRPPSPSPTQTNYNPYTGTPQVTSQSQSRAYFLHRPFYSVAELGYVFSDTPWRNLDFFNSESGYAALLDVFCIQDADQPDGLVAGKVNLNTRQTPVLAAVLAGAYMDPVQPGSAGATGRLDGATANAVASALTARITDTQNYALGTGPLTNLGELVGKWIASKPISQLPVGNTPSGLETSKLPLSSPFADGKMSYSGFSGGDWDQSSTSLISMPRKPKLTSPARDVYSAYMGSSTLTTNSSHNGTQETVVYIQRFREAPIRALANAGQTRVWNLLIDVVAQTGRYPTTAANAANPLDAFYVEGEQRYWVHIAIDRLTGQVIDKQIEVVKE